MFPLRSRTPKQVQSLLKQALAQPRTWSKFEDDPDDREEEHEVVNKWKNLFALDVEIEGKQKPYFKIVLGKATSL